MRSCFCSKASYASGQLFGAAGPARVVVEATDAVIDFYLAPKN